MMLDKIYGFDNYKVTDNGNLIVEQHNHGDSLYTCHIRSDGSATVSVDTKGNFLKLVFGLTENDLKICGVDASASKIVDNGISKANDCKSDIINYCFRQFKLMIDLMFVNRVQPCDFIARVSALIDLLVSCKIISFESYRLLSSYMEYCSLCASMPYPYNLLRVLVLNSEEVTDVKK